MVPVVFAPAATAFVPSPILTVLPVVAPVPEANPPYTSPPSTPPIRLTVLPIAAPPVLLPPETVYPLPSVRLLIVSVLFETSPAADPPTTSPLTVGPDAPASPTVILLSLLKPVSLVPSMPAVCSVSVEGISLTCSAACADEENSRLPPADRVSATPNARRRCAFIPLNIMSSSSCIVHETHGELN